MLFPSKVLVLNATHNQDRNTRRRPQEVFDRVEPLAGSRSKHGTTERENHPGDLRQSLCPIGNGPSVALSTILDRLPQERVFVDQEQRVYVNHLLATLTGIVGEKGIASYPDVYMCLDEYQPRSSPQPASAIGDCRLQIYAPKARYSGPV